MTVVVIVLHNKINMLNRGEELLDGKILHFSAGLYLYRIYYFKTI